MTAVRKTELEWQGSVIRLMGRGNGGEYEFTYFANGTITPED